MRKDEFILRFVYLHMHNISFNNIYSTYVYIPIFFYLEVDNNINNRFDNNRNHINDNGNNMKNRNENDGKRKERRKSNICLIKWNKLWEDRLKIDWLTLKYSQFLQNAFNQNEKKKSEYISFVANNNNVYV